MSRRDLVCDCCARKATRTVGTFPYYVCPAHARAKLDTVERLYQTKHGIKAVQP